MRLALVDDTNTVWTVVEADKNFAPPTGSFSVEVDDTVATGDLWNGTTFTKPPPPEPPPENVSVGQLMDIAVQIGLVSLDDIAKLIPVVKGEFTQKKDGTIVADVAKIDDLAQAAADIGAVPPKDIPPTPADSVDVALSASEILDQL